MRAILVLLLMTGAVAAEPEPEPEAEVEEEAPWDVTLSSVAHAIELSYEASAGVADDGAGDALAVASVGGDAGWTGTFTGPEGGQYQIGLGGGATVSRFEGATSATGAATRAHLALGPAPVPQSSYRS